MASFDEIIENAKRHVQVRLDKGEEESVFCIQISPMEMMIKFPWHPQI